MNRDLVDQLDAYFSQVDERQGPVTADQIAQVIDKVHALPPAPVPVRQRPRVWVAVAAAAAVLIAIGIVPLLVGSRDTETSPATESPVATTPTTRPATTPTTGPPVATVDEATARSQALPYDPAVHDLCKWFSSDEITEIVSDAYEAAGATVLPDAFGAGYPSTYPPFTCGWITEDTKIGSADWDGTGNHNLLVSMDTLRFPPADPVLGTLSGGEVSVMEETGSRTIKEEIDDSYKPPDTLSDGLSLVGARVRDLDAWTPPGPPARWLFIDQIVQVEGRPEIHLHISVISDPPVEFTSGSKAHRLVDIGLIVADTLLQRLNWLPGPTSATVIPATTAALTTSATAPSPIREMTKVDAPAVADEGTIVVGPNGTEWVSLAGTLRGYGVENKVIEPPELAARKPYIGPIAVTEDGDVWVSGFNAWLFPDTGALARFDGTAWEVPTPLNDEELPAVAMAITQNGDLWAVIADVEAVVDLQTGAHGPDYQVHDWVLARFDGTSWTTYQEPKEFTAGLPGLLESHGNTIYLSGGSRFGGPDGFQGIVTFDGDTWRHTLTDEDVTFLSFEPDGTTRVEVADQNLSAEQIARLSGEPFDPAVHDLCSWFTTEEINEIITFAYLAHDEEPPPGTFAPAPSGTLTSVDEIGCTWGSDVGLNGQRFGSLLVFEFRSANHPDFGYFDEPDEFAEYGPDGRVRIGNLSNGAWAYVPGVYANFTVREHDDVILFWLSVPYRGEYPTPSLNPIGLAIADEMLRRIGWVPDNWAEPSTTAAATSTDH